MLGLRVYEGSRRIDEKGSNRTARPMRKPCPADSVALAIRQESLLAARNCRGVEAQVADLPALPKILEDSYHPVGTGKGGPAKPSGRCFCRGGVRVVVA